MTEHQHTTMTKLALELAGLLGRLRHIGAVLHTGHRASLTRGDGELLAISIHPDLTISIEVDGELRETIVYNEETRRAETPDGRVLRWGEHVAAMAGEAAKRRAG